MLKNFLKIKYREIMVKCNKIHRNNSRLCPQLLTKKSKIQQNQ